MSDEVLPDVEGGLVDWLKTRAQVTALVAQRVFFGVPRTVVEADDYPMIVAFRVGGGDDDSEAPTDLALVQFDVWGRLRGKEGAMAVANALRSELKGLRGRTVLRAPTADTPGVVAFGATVDTVLFRPDPADQRPRYVVQALVSTIATPATG